MLTRRLGRTGHESSIAILGAAAFATVTPDQAEAGFHLALERGVNHLDIAPSYGDAEVLVGPHVPVVRDRLFVAGKTMRKHPDGVQAQMEETLRRLGCDHLDLYQLHAVTNLAALDERGAAAEVILAARDEGVVRYAGITGHDMEAPATFVEALRRYDFDTVMFPVNPRQWADASYRDAAEELLEVCAGRDLGVMAIKAGARRPWSDGQRARADHWATTWYEPWSDPDRLAEGVRFTLSVPGVHAFCTTGDAAVLPRALDAAQAFTPMDAAERDAAIAAWASEPVIFPIPT